MGTWIHSLGSPDYSWAAPVWKMLEVHQQLSFFLCTASCEHALPEASQTPCGLHWASGAQRTWALLHERLQSCSCPHSHSIKVGSGVTAGKWRSWNFFCLSSLVHLYLRAHWYWDLLAQELSHKPFFSLGLLHFAWLSQSSASTGAAQRPGKMDAWGFHLSTLSTKPRKWIT